MINSVIYLPALLFAIVELFWRRAGSQVRSSSAAPKTWAQPNSIK
jgi:hypothetical protein